MSKDPAFLFYPNDWIGGTMGMTFEEKGAYVELLMLQFNRGHMTKHMIGQAVGHLWVNIEDKFRMDKDGLYFNARLDLEKEKRKNYSNSRRNNLLGKNQHTNKVGHMTSHMENENIKKNSINNKIGKEEVKKEVSNIDNVEDVIYWETEKKTFLNAGDWAFKFCSDKSISVDFYDECTQEFINDIELKEHFKNAKELRSHFTSWFNKYKKNGHKPINGSHKPSSSDAKIERIRNI